MKNKNKLLSNKVSSPRDVVGDLRLTWLYNIKKFSLFHTAKSAEDSRQRRSRMTTLFNAKAFTLIELLVVVLIIGILAAVAVPQYQTAVEKSRAAEVLIQARHLAEAEELYYLANGTYTRNYDDLGVKNPESDNFHFFIDSPIYNIVVSNGKYSFRYFMRNIAVERAMKGRFMCIAKLDNKLGTQVCRSLSGDPIGFKYPYTEEGQAYYLN